MICPGGKAMTAHVPPSTTLPLHQWLRLLPPVVASLALVTLEGVINPRTIALASQCQAAPEWEFDFVRALAGWNPAYEHHPGGIFSIFRGDLTRFLKRPG